MHTSQDKSSQLVDITSFLETRWMTWSSRWWWRSRKPLLHIYYNIKAIFRWYICAPRPPVNAVWDKDCLSWDMITTVIYYIILYNIFVSIISILSSYTSIQSWFGHCRCRRWMRRQYICQIPTFLMIDLFPKPGTLDNIIPVMQCAVTLQYCLIPVARWLFCYTEKLFLEHSDLGRLSNIVDHHTYTWDESVQTSPVLLTVLFLTVCMICKWFVCQLGHDAPCCWWSTAVQCMSVGDSAMACSGL